MVKNLNLLVTRPLPFAMPLCDAIVAQGGEATLFPTIEFASMPQMPPIDDKIATFDWLIFVSPYAVSAYQHLHGSPPPPSCQCAAIGEGTAKALQTVGITVSASPQEGVWNSESLLALPQFQDVARKKIGIIKGEGGREYLEKILHERGAVITPIILYRRVLPNVNVLPYIDLLKNGKVDAIICTSFEGVSNLKKLFGNAGAFAYMQKIPLIVVSERIKILAHDLGFQTIWVARNASTEAILSIINQEHKKE